MEHPGLIHPEFGLLCPRPRFRREVQIAAISLLLGGLAGAVCVSAVTGGQHRDTLAARVFGEFTPVRALRGGRPWPHAMPMTRPGSSSVASTTKGETAIPRRRQHPSKYRRRA